MTLRTNTRVEYSRGMNSKKCLTLGLSIELTDLIDEARRDESPRDFLEKIIKDGCRRILDERSRSK